MPDGGTWPPDRLTETQDHSPSFRSPTDRQNPFVPRTNPANIPPTMRLPLLPLLVLGLLGAASSAVAAPELAYVAGNYESVGTVAHAESGYDGPVSLRSLLALDFDLAEGVRRNPDIARIEIIQEQQRLLVRSRRANGKIEWTGEWGRDGGFEATIEGVKLLLRSRRHDAQLHMLTLSTIKEGTILLVKVEQITLHPTGGPTAKPVGTFVFLRASEA